MPGSSNINEKQAFPLPVRVFGRPDSTETLHTRERLRELQIPFTETNVETDDSAARFVERINHGARTTPTIVFGDQDFIIVEPTDLELIRALRRAGYEV